MHKISLVSLVFARLILFFQDLFRKLNVVLFQVKILLVVVVSIVIQINLLSNLHVLLDVIYCFKRGRTLELSTLRKSLVDFIQSNGLIWI